MASLPKRIMVHDPEFEGSYELVECRSDGSLVLRPVREKLSDVLHETADAIFLGAEFTTHLQRVAASEDDLSRDQEQ